MRRCFCVCSDEYFRMKLQWKSVSEEQERRNSRLRDYKSLIGETKDVRSLYLSQHQMGEELELNHGPC